jgi:hypothetical protein
VGLEHGHRLARLHEQRLVVLERDQLAFDRLQARLVAGRLADAAVDDQLGGVLGHVRMQVVLEHRERRLLLPAAAARWCRHAHG